MDLPNFPQWVLDAPSGIERAKAEHRFLVLLVELYSGSTRDISRVAKMLDITTTNLRSRISASRGRALRYEDRVVLVHRYREYSRGRT